MVIDLTQIILGILTIISGIVVRYLVPLIKEKTSEKTRETLQAVIDIAVLSAEQLFNTEQGKEKKAYVVDLLAKQGYNIELDVIDAQIEASVKTLKMELGQ